jgi:outer membrane lipoprotein-sorting protein
MKKILFILIALLLAGITVDAQKMNPDKILKKHFKAIGQENLDKVKTMTVTGTNSMMGMEFPFTMQAKRPGKLRIEAEVQGNKMIQTYNGKEGYMVAPWTGTTDPQQMEEDQLGQLKDQADIDGKLYNYKEKGSQLELVGNEDINGVSTFKLKLTEKPVNEGGAAQISHWFIDSKEFQLVKSIATANMQGVDTEVETIFSNFKIVDGINMAFSMEMIAGGNPFSQLTLDKITFNEEMDDQLFEKPAN